jgi:hypothetical protein
VQYDQLMKVRDAVKDALRNCPIPHYETKLKGFLLELNTALDNLEPATRGQFPPP